MEGHDACTQLAGRNYLRTLLWDDIVLADFAQPVTKRLANRRLLPRYCDDGNRVSLLQSKLAIRTFFSFLFLVVRLCRRSHRDRACGGEFHSTFVRLARCRDRGAWCEHFRSLVALAGTAMARAAGLDDWIFSWDYVYGRRPMSRLGWTALPKRSLLEHVTRHWTKSSSSGTAWGRPSPSKSSRARLQSTRLRTPRPCGVPADGWIDDPKFTLHPAGEGFRNRAAHIVRERSIAWAEYHARSDAISFYKFDPVKLARFYGDPISGKPLLRRLASANAHEADLLALPAEVYALALPICDGK